MGLSWLSALGSLIIRGEQAQKEGENIRTYHAQLKEVLKTFIAANSRLKGVKLPIGTKGVTKCDIVTCVLFILIQDNQEGHSLCGRYV